LPKKYSAETIKQTAAAYSTHGSITKAARDKGIPRKTVTKWRDERRPEWLDGTIQFRREKNDELDALYTEVMHLAVRQSIEKLPSASAQQAAVIAGIFHDKRSLLRHEPKPTDKSGDEKTLVELAKSFVLAAQEARKLIEAEKVPTTTYSIERSV
jgi:hypothetical protein